MLTTVPAARAPSSRAGRRADGEVAEHVRAPDVQEVGARRAADAGTSAAVSSEVTPGTCSEGRSPLAGSGGWWPRSAHRCSTASRLVSTPASSSCSRRNTPSASSPIGAHAAHRAAQPRQVHRGAGGRPGGGDPDLRRAGRRPAPAGMCRHRPAQHVDDVRSERGEDRHAGHPRRAAGRHAPAHLVQLRVGQRCGGAGGTGQQGDLAEPLEQVRPGRCLRRASRPTVRLPWCAMTTPVRPSSAAVVTSASSGVPKQR